MGNMRIPETVHESWYEYLQPLFNDKRMENLRTSILPKSKFYPVSTQIFRVFSMPLDKIRVVALGQDPYSHGEAIGLAFAVNKSQAYPGSLAVIRNELRREYKEGLIQAENTDAEEWRELKHWRNQGVFLLNTALTVKDGQSDSHTEHWKWFTREVIHLISTKVKPIWLLWGSKAQQFETYIDKRIVINPSIKAGQSNPKDWNIIMKASHPAAELYPDSQLKFTGCSHFWLCNEILKAKGEKPILW